jgi:hypothetical protein
MGWNSFASAIGDSAALRAALTRVGRSLCRVVSGTYSKAVNGPQIRKKTVIPMQNAPKGYVLLYESGAVMARYRVRRNQGYGSPAL